MKRLRFLARLNQTAPDGSVVICLGLRVGWWPCLGGPFIQLGVWKWRLELWYGKETYKELANG